MRFCRHQPPFPSLTSISSIRRDRLEFDSARAQEHSRRPSGIEREHTMTMTKTELLFRLALFFLVTTLSLAPVSVAWTGEIRGRVVCDVCGDSSIGPEDHFLEGAEVAVLCITKTGEVLNYQAFTNSRGVYTVAETMPESERWDACLARPISSFHEQCNRVGSGKAAVKFTYSRPSGHSYTVRPFVYQHVDAPMYCM